jgi:small-conductance mechanosensitive channel
MDFFTNIDDLPRNLGVIAAELFLVIVVCLGLANLLRLLMSRLLLISALEPYHPRLQTIRTRSRLMMAMVAVVATIGLVIWNIILISRDTDLLHYTNTLFIGLPANFWRQFTWGAIQIIALALLVRPLLRFLRYLLAILEVHTKNLSQLKSDDKAIGRFFTALSHALSNTVWLGILVVATNLLNLPEGVVAYASLGLRIYLIVALGLVLVKAITAIVDTLDALSLRHAQTETLLLYYQSIRGLIPLVRRTLEYAVYLSVLTLVFLQFDPFEGFAIHGPRLLQVLGVFLLGRISIEIMRLFVDRQMFNSEDSDGVDELELQRKMTLAPLMKSFLAYLIYFFILVFALRAMTINPMPLLAGAGIISIIVGLGAQPVINDLVSGFFILLENLFLVGDYIETGTARGTVEAVDIRTTRIRDPNGQQHILRNGQLGAVINYSKKYTFAVVEVGVRHEANLEQVSQLLKEIGATLNGQSMDVLEVTEVQGVERFSGDGPILRTVTRVKPGRHQQVARIYRRLIKERFDAEGITLTAT